MAPRSLGGIWVKGCRGVIRLKRVASISLCAAGLTRRWSGRDP